MEFISQVMGFATILLQLIDEVVFPVHMHALHTFSCEVDPGGYQWPPTFSDWLKTVFWQIWQFTIFSSF
jgi:hypothetical protein